MREATGCAEADGKEALQAGQPPTGKHRASVKESKSGFLGRGEGLLRGEGHRTREA